MKKLFFGALLAIVAVGGAYAQSGSFYAAGSTSPSPDYICEGGSTACHLKYGLPLNTTVYTAPVPNQTTPINISSYRYSL